MIKKVLVCAEDQLVLRQIDRILKNQQIRYDLVQGMVSKEQVMTYDIVLIHPSWRLPSLFVFVENLVLANQVFVLWIQSGLGVPANTKLKNYSSFQTIQEIRLEAELPIALAMATKLSTWKKHQEGQWIKERNKLDGLNLYLRAKLHLMGSGMSETEAHKAILKCAMDDQITKTAACLKILKKK